MHKVEYLCAIHIYLCYGASLGSWLESLQQWLGMDDFIASLDNIRWRIIKYLNMGCFQVLFICIRGW